MRSLMRAFATALAILLAMTAVRPGPAHAAAPDPEPEPEAEVAPAPVPKPPKVDGLGRVFPDPFQLRRARAWTGGGVVLTATGAALVLTGLTLVSSFARGELATPVGGYYGVLAISGVGMGLAVAGIPMLSAGTFTSKQLLRTIKGAEKVPRTVANEGRYWTAYLSRMYSQAMLVSGGGAVLFGVLSIVAVAALQPTDRYKPEYWAIPAGLIGGGAILLVSGFAVQRKADRAMEAVWQEVDPRRQPPATSRRPALSPSPPILAVAPVRRPDGTIEVLGTLSWSLAF